MSTYPLVSIALCTFNGEKYLSQQIDSLLAQTYPNIEIIVADDCSTDTTQQILLGYANISNLKVYNNQKNIGLLKNFEGAISLCNGDFIALADQDDIWKSNKIQDLISNMHGAILIYADSELIDGNDKFLNKRLSSIRNMVDGGHPLNFIFHNCISGHTMLFKKELKNYILPFPQFIFHDWWIAFVAAATGKIHYYEKSLVLYRQHDFTFTDILKRRGSEKEITKDKSQKLILITEQIVSTLNIFYSFNYLKPDDKILIDELIQAYKSRVNSFFSFKLFTFLFRYRKLLYYIPKNSTMGKLIYILKESLGTKTKKFFYNFKESLF